MSDEIPVEVGHALADLGAAALAGATADLDAPTIEAPKNWGPRIAVMLAAVGHFVADDWNAAAVSTWVLEAAARARRPAPITGAFKGADLVAQLQAQKRWLPKALLTPAKVRPGMIAASKASARSPVVWVGIVRHVGPDGTLTCLDGDAGPLLDRVGLRNRKLSDALFLGCGFL